MNKFASKYGFLVAAMALAFGESNAAIEYDEVNNAATLSSEQLGAINKRMGDLQNNLKEANEALEKQETEHQAATKVLNDRVAELEAKLAAKAGSTPADEPTSPAADADPVTTVKPGVSKTSAHMRIAKEAGLI